MHPFGFVSLDKVWLPAVAGEEPYEFFVVHAAKHGGIRDLPAIEVKNRQHRAVTRRVQKFVAMPARSQGPGFGLAVSHYATSEQIGVIEHCAACMHDRITQFSAFMNRARSFRRRMAGNSAREGKLFEQLPQAFFILSDVGIKLTV